MDESLFYTCINRMMNVLDAKMVDALIDNLCVYVGPLADNEMVSAMNDIADRDIRTLMMLSLADILSGQTATD